MSKISSGLGRIRGALRTNQPIEGAVCIPETQTFENGTIEELIVSDCSNIYRDLSTWRVSVPNTELTQVNKQLQSDVLNFFIRFFLLGCILVAVIKDYNIASVYDWLHVIYKK